MLEAEKVIMKRALELARRGAGLVSPNPMVGAVLVKEGRVIGEGYHRYDRLKHAESYAIEAAGAEARGSTLYCTLEPCCHHGRTAPCTDALIEAGIARAIIATKDPDPRVNGKGIQQLREAGIEVEIGLLEDEAIKINEAYSKFVTTRTPFLHGVIAYSEAGERALLMDWMPSASFIRTASLYDSIVVMDLWVAELAVLEAQLARERHRPAILVADADVLEQCRTRFTTSDSEITGIAFDQTAPSHRIKAGHSVPLRLVDSAVGEPDLIKVQPELEELGVLLGAMNVTGTVLMPGAFDLGEPSNFAALDKLTIIVPTGIDYPSMRPFSLGNLEFDFEDVSASETLNGTELTGYPALLEIA
jgi:diaminohydroxyphosphoribosylaminopyrimidine deaminase/5-amino-6-(5-phosphoribosylamino)uracil reductase